MLNKMDTQNQAEPQLNGAGDGTPDSEDEEQYFIRLDKRKWAEELSRLEREDPQGFGQAFHSRIGSRAAERHLPKIREMEVELENERRTRRHLELASMSKEEVESQYASDQRFAQEWTEFIHSNPEELEARREFVRAQNRVESLFARARSRGVPEDTLDGLKRDLAGGRFDKDEDGRPVTWKDGGFDLFQEALTDSILSTIQQRPSQQDDEEEEAPSAPPARRAQASRPAGNPVLTQGGPDNTPASGGISRRKVYRTQQQVDRDLYEGKITSSQARQELEKGLPYS